MIDLTPLDVRNKVGDFRRGMRGYDPAEVDTFVVTVADRMEEYVRELNTLRERNQHLEEQVSAQVGRERAVQDALVSAQQLGEDVKDKARKEAELILKEAELEAASRKAEVERHIQGLQRGLEDLERRRRRFLAAMRGLLERELDALEVEEDRNALEVARDALEPAAPGEDGTEAGGEDDASVRGADGVDSVGNASGEPGEDGLWLSSILKQDEEGEGREDAPAPE